MNDPFLHCLTLQGESPSPVSPYNLNVPPPADCVDVDSVHNDYQRHMPYALFFPELIKNVMTTGWAKLQQDDGMITESLSAGCMGVTGKLDGGGGRRMGDVSTIFVIEALELYEWTNDKAWLNELEPVVQA